MKLHDLRPPEGSNTARTRVGRGIAAGKGKTAGRGTKGQKARAGGSIPPWFEGGQTPLHMRIPKLRGFKNRGKIDYEVVNVGDIAARVDAGAFTEAGAAPKKGEQLTINADILRAVGLVRNVKKPLKILGNGDLATALFVVADAYTKSATAKIEAAGGTVNVLEIPAESRPALGLDGPSAEAGDDTAAEAAAPPKASRPAKAAPEAKVAVATKAPKAAKAPAADEPATAAGDSGTTDAAAVDVAQEETATASADQPIDAPDAVADDGATGAAADDAGGDGSSPTGDESA
jgi:large subunit ribosomal protein L15